MREIKFRAWDKEVNHMYYNSGHVIIDMKGHCFNLQTGVQLEPLLFTGLLDKNGKDIYEGDILSAPFANGDNRRDKKHKSFYCSVYFNSGAFHFSPHGDIFSGDYRWYPDWYDCEVIGNIYENPELLEAK